MLGTPREIRVIFTEEFRRTLQRRSYRILTLAVPVILLILLVAVPVIRGISDDDEDRDKDQDQIGILELSGELAVDARHGTRVSDISGPGVRDSCAAG